MGNDPKSAIEELQKGVKDSKKSKVAKEKKSAKKEEDDDSEKEQAGENKIKELISDLQRLQADFENYRKRADKECSMFREYACADIIKRLLSVLDSFELALKNTENHAEFVKGMEMIYSQLYTALKEEGLKQIDAEGKFDPHFHEVMISEKSDAAEGTILEELQKGYRFKERVLRYSKVKVAKK